MFQSVVFINFCNIHFSRLFPIIYISAFRLATSFYSPDRAILYLFVFDQARLEELHELWKLLLEKSAEKQKMLIFTQRRVIFVIETNEIISWINEKVPYVL